MAVVKELIRTEENGAISFGDYELAQKSKLSDYQHQGDMYKVKTFKEITKLERNGMFVYESVPGTAVFNLTQSEAQMDFHVEGPEDAQITVEMEPDIVLAQFNTGRMYMKQAVALATEAEKLQGSAFTKFKMEKLDPLYQAALPYMKKAYELDTTDTQTKRLLGNIYYQLNMENELNALGL